MSRLIDADELMQTYAKFVAPSNNSDFENAPTWNDAVSLLESAPTVKTINHGKWIKVEDDYNNHLYECSCCHTWTSLPTEDVNDGNIRYCWSCGARMDGVKI